MVPVAGCRDIPAWLSCSWPMVGRLCLGELSVSPWVPIPGVCVGKPLPHGGAWASHSAIKEVKLWPAQASCSSVSRSEGTGCKVSIQSSGLQGVFVLQEGDDDGETSLELQRPNARLGK